MPSWNIRRGYAIASRAGTQSRKDGKMSKFTLLATLDVLNHVVWSSESIGKRNKADVVCDRIRQASTEATLPGFMERLCALLNIGPGSLNSTKYKDFLLGCHDKGAADSVLQWIRRNPSPLD